MLNSRSSPSSDRPGPSPAWLAQLLREKCGIQSLRPFQSELGLHLINGKDVFLAIATGQGKTIVFMAPLIVAQAQKEHGIAFMIVPTKSLAEQQCQTATRFGIKAFALTEDTVRDANLEGRNLFTELWNSAREGVCIAVMSPQMLASTSVRSQLRKPKLKGAIRWMFIDEVHLVEETDSVFCTPYRSIEFARARLSPATVWGAATGTITPNRAASVASLLGFTSDRSINLRHSLDRPNIKFIPMFFKHAYTGTTFLDLSFLIPFQVSALSSIPRAIIFVTTIQVGCALMNYLESLIPVHIPRRREAIKLFNSLYSPEYRGKFKDDFESAESPLRLGIVTDTFTFGLDLVVDLVIIYGLRSHESLNQQGGRAGRNGSRSTLYTFAPPWMQNVELPKTPSKQQVEDKKRREQLPTITQLWYNPTNEMCSRAANMQYFGELDQHNPSTCLCSVHEPMDAEEKQRAETVKQWVVYSTEMSPKHKLPVSDRKWNVLTKAQQESCILIVENWRNTRWSTSVNRKGPEKYLPSNVLLPGPLIRILAEKAHLCTTLPRLREVLRDWKECYFQQHGESLFEFLTEAMKGYQEMTDDAKKKGKQREAKVPTKKPDESGESSLGLPVIHIKNEPPSPQIHSLKNTIRVPPRALATSLIPIPKLSKAGTSTTTTTCTRIKIEDSDTLPQGYLSRNTIRIPPLTSSAPLPAPSRLPIRIVSMQATRRTRTPSPPNVQSLSKRPMAGDVTTGLSPQKKKRNRKQTQ
ncbi:hypothetical protein PM082_023230 [Marasmius tenuissimus]|nr:hypothetical protein PM082_023230 [Marasmius tenuissimus]